jgi:activating signal cointegrator complex subunit 3
MEPHTHTYTQKANQGVLQKKDFKIIYVAPMKALAAEVVAKFAYRLGPLGMEVKELTGDMQLTKREIEETQVIVTTPEKWDVITRKSSEGGLAQQLKLLIIDEVHLLADDRGSVIESIVARTLRQVEQSQCMVRIVGLSATLPNYKDVATFLKVNHQRGLFHFDNSFRPVPLEQTFIGVREKNRMKQPGVMNRIAYEIALKSLRHGNQVMVFVHSRKDTVVTARAVRDEAVQASTMEEFHNESHEKYHVWEREVGKSRNQELKELFKYGMGMHNAGMLRKDRTLTEELFSAGVIRVLFCTATLAWGVNLPAHTVVIKGTKVYNAVKGDHVSLSMLDVMQIFGRAGRPQFDTSGEAMMITTHDELSHYLGLLCHQLPIESNFIKALPDHLNAEIVSGTVTNVKEAIVWLSYTYLYVRMMGNPLVYGLNHSDMLKDPDLYVHRIRLIESAAKILDECRMARFDQSSGQLAVTDRGRVASHYYIQHQTVSTFNDKLEPYMSDAQALAVICSSSEFEQLKVRDEELSEMEKLSRKGCPVEIKGSNGIGGFATPAGKTSLLLQCYITEAHLTSFTLISDQAFVIQSAGRICRALFEMCLKRGWSAVCDQLLTWSKCIETRTWWFQSPLRQFRLLPVEDVIKLENRRASVDKLLDMEAKDIGMLMNHQRMGDRVQACARMLPQLKLAAKIQPITRGILRLTLTVTADFAWKDSVHGANEAWWIWVEDADSEHIYHHEYFLLHKKQKDEEHVLAFTIPIFEPLPPQYFVRATSDRWVGMQNVVAVSFQHLILPDRHPPHTELLDLEPLPLSALHNEAFESMYASSFPTGCFNPVQTQIFHTVYHTDKNVLLGAPTGSGKTVCAELAIMRMLNDHPGKSCVYVAPLKALARERLEDWKRKFGKLGRKVVELTGDSTPDQRALATADILITTPEKWDGVSRNWKQRDYVKRVQCMVIDEIHLLGEERGPVLEVIVSRMRFISVQTSSTFRVVGLSTALANASDLADWLGIQGEGLYNFRPSVRPVPMEAHINGFPGKHYCPRMATMNKPTFLSIQRYSPKKPVLVFVSSRRQTRLTALDLISYCAAEENPKNFLHMPEEDISHLASQVRDQALKHTLVFGIGIHHAGLAARDRELVEELFCNGKIQVLVCTSTLAWGVNFPAHLVVIKGTEFFDGKQGRYVDFPITDVLQMMGRAGRPQFDDKGVAVIMVHEPKKNFYKKFLYEPFPVESHLRDVLHNHFNAEVAGGTIKNKQDAVDYLTWTYFFRRLVINPSYYHLEGTSAADVESYLLDLVDTTLRDLEAAGCCEINDDFLVSPTTLGFIASYYYLEYTTVGLFRDAIVDEDLASSVSPHEHVRVSAAVKLSSPEGDVKLMPALCKLLSDAKEFAELPVRHNEDKLNEELAATVPWPVDPYTVDSAHTKAFLLMQCHMGRLPLPIADYNNDTKSVMDQIFRVVNALVDISADEGLLDAALSTMRISQCLVQAQFPSDDEICQLPHIHRDVIQHCTVLQQNGRSRGSETRAKSLSELQKLDVKKLEEALKGHLRGSPHDRPSERALSPQQRLAEFCKVLQQVPKVKIGWRVIPGDDDGVDGGRTGKDANETSPTEVPFCYGTNGTSIDVVADSEMSIEIDMTAVNARAASDATVYTPYQTKSRKYGWWVVVGSTEGELLALKKVPMSGKQKFRLEVDAPEDLGQVQLHLHVVSDCMRGLDQHFSIKLNVLEGETGYDSEGEDLDHLKVEDGEDEVDSAQVAGTSDHVSEVEARRSQWVDVVQ